MFLKVNIWDIKTFVSIIITKLNINFSNDYFNKRK